MQLMTSGDESPRLLRLASQFLLDVAQVMEAEAANGGPLMPAAPAPTVDEFTAEHPVVPLNVVPPAPVVPPVPDTAGGGAAPSVPVPPLPVVTPNPSVPTAPLPTAGNAATSAVMPVTTGAVELDSRGFPHDERIHSETPTLKKDGEWRQRRNLDPETLRSVEAELRARGYGVPVGTPRATPQVPLPPPPVIPPPPTIVVGSNAATATPVTVPLPPANVPVPPPVAASVSSGPDAFTALMQRVSRHSGADGLCMPAKMAGAWAKVGVKGWGDFCVRKDLIPAMNAELDTMGAM